MILPLFLLGIFFAQFESVLQFIQIKNIKAWNSIS
jgi:hypothetical protein